jgi:transcriptional regulator fur family protein
MEQWDDPLGVKNLRKTRARKAIITILSEDKDRSFSAEELHSACGSDLQMDLSTVYRTLNTLTESGLVTKSIRDDGRAYFQLAEPQGSVHHHRIICSRCKASADIAMCPLHDLEQQILSETGFLITSHSLELTGLCPDCKAEEEHS